MVAQNSETPFTAKLVKKLAAKINPPLSLNEPFITQDRIPQTHSRHVLVIWDAWKNLPRETRSEIILNAFQAANALNGDTLRMALGLTQGEAFDLGYLPFEIVGLVRPTDPVRSEDVQKAIESVGGIHIKVGKSHQLRFPSRDYADMAYRQLAAKIPGPYWTITQEVSLGSHA